MVSMLCSMEGDFNIHLASNVSPDLFPNNQPAKFSTILANEIDVSEGKWEVGIRQIMYPTHVATTSHEDTLTVFKYEIAYRQLLPHPSSDAKDLSKFGASINLNRVPFPMTKQLPFIIDFIQREVNQSTWCKDKHIIKMEYKSQEKKFVFNVLIKDIILVLTPDLAKLLGFKKQILHKGTHVADEEFTNQKVNYEDIKLYLYDLTALQSERYGLPQTYEVKEKKNVKMFSAQIEREFKDTMPDEYVAAPTILFTIKPHSGQIQTASMKKVPVMIQRHEKKIKFFHFDKVATDTFGLDKLYHYKENNTITFKKVETIPQSLKKIEVTVYYDMAKEFFNTLNPNPVKTIPIKSKKQLKDPKELLLLLNGETAAYGYNFEYNANIQRYILKTGKDFAIQMSQSLASILGFETYDDALYLGDTETTATEFPILDRLISSLYVYSNIIDAVYIGDVQAPLLLVCPFKGKDEKDVVHQLEFLNPTYVPLNRTKLLQIDISIHDDAGALIPFLHGKSVLTLHFRKMKL